MAGDTRISGDHRSSVADDTGGVSGKSAKNFIQLSVMFACLVVS